MMRSKITMTFSIAMFLGFFSILFISSNPANVFAHEKNIVVIMDGVGVLVPDDDPRIDGIPGACFEMALVDAKRNRNIGTGIDCIDIVDSDAAGNVSVNQTSIFNLVQGEIRFNGLTTVVPVFGDSSPEYTHVTGNVTSDKNIISGTRKFKDATGNVRLSGAVNLTEFPDSMIFNCIFIIDVDKDSDNDSDDDRRRRRRRSDDNDSDDDDE